MGLPETFNAVAPSIVALASLAVPPALQVGPWGGVPNVLGTGFLVDPRGVALTAGHVARDLMALPKNQSTGQHAATAMIFRAPTRVGDGLEMKPLWVNIRGYSMLREFTVGSDAFFGEPLPDLAMVQPTSATYRLCRSTPRLVRSTSDVRCRSPVFLSALKVFCFACRSRSIVVQMMPYLRHGIVSSVFPFPCPQPHGFTIDAMSHGGASGSPIFAVDEPKVLGMLYAAFPGETRITYALPGHLLNWAVRTAVSDGTLDTRDVPSMTEYESSGRELDGWIESRTSTRRK